MQRVRKRNHSPAEDDSLEYTPQKRDSNDMEVDEPDIPTRRTCFDHGVLHVVSDRLTRAPSIEKKSPGEPR